MLINNKLIMKIRKKFWKAIAKQGFHLSLTRIALRKCGYLIGDAKIFEEFFVVDLYNSKDNVIIGDNVLIAPRVTLITQTHPIDPDRFSKPAISGKVIIENDSWIGTHATILPNVTIGKGSIVGAGSVVTKNVPSYTIVAGTPAKVIKKLNKS